MNNTTKKVLSWLSTGLIFGGILIIFYPALTSLYSRIEQRRLVAELSYPLADEPLSVGILPETPVLEELESSSNNQEEKLPAEIKPAPMMLLEIPALNLSVGVVKGTTAKDLRAGPGWYTQSALPGEGNTAIAGHLNIYGSWFRHLNKLKPSQEIRVSYNGRQYVYEVEEVWEIKSNDWSVIRSVGYPALTLTTCDPNGDANIRLAVRAKVKAK